MVIELNTYLFCCFAIILPEAELLFVEMATVILYWRLR